MRGDPHFVVKDKNDKPLDDQAWGEGQAINHKTALQFVITWSEYCRVAPLVGAAALLYADALARARPDVVVPASERRD
jgi:hypothetical protein